MNPPVQSSVSPSLRALLAGSVDYAGLFPPAALALEPALENQSSYVRADDAWMLGRFVLPTAKLSEASALLAERFDTNHSLRISALGPKANSTDEFLRNLRTGLGGLVNFWREHGTAVAIQQFEASLPPVTASAPVLGALLWQAAEIMENVLPGRLRAFWEVPLTEDLPATLRGFADHNSQIPIIARGYSLPRFQADGQPLYFAPVARNFRCLPFGVKFRTGGTEAAAFPTPTLLATALIAARDVDVAVKFTAGLHHPLRHFNETVGTTMHGFLNVFAAGILAREHRLDAAETQAILEDERAESFRFDADGFAWRNRRVPTAALAAHRQFVTSFGSCSFDEPRDDLRRLGLML